VPRKCRFCELIPRTRAGYHAVALRCVTASIHRSAAFVIVALAVELAGCSGSPFVPSNFFSGPTTYMVGGTVSGLVGNGLTLSNEGARVATIARAANGTYPNLVGMNVAGTAYDITILTQPSYLSQTCVIAVRSDGRPV
jgi:hypothetical protein